MAGGSSGILGTGGMVTKLQAADLARRGGTTVIIANGADLSILGRLVNGGQEGTRFLPVSSTLASRKRYLLAGGRKTAKVVIDEGAVKALINGSSLLPVGISMISGRFQRGDPVSVIDSNGVEVARGLVNYPEADLQRILGVRSDQIAAILGYDYGAEVIHRDNLIILRNEN